MMGLRAEFEDWITSRYADDFDTEVYSLMWDAYRAGEFAGRVWLTDATARASRRRQRKNNDGR